MAISTIISSPKPTQTSQNKPKLNSTNPNHKGREQEKKETNYKSSQKAVSRMAISTYLPIVTLNVNGLNSPIKRHRVAEWIKQKQDPSICCLQETHFRCKDTHRLK